MDESKAEVPQLLTRLQAGHKPPEGHLDPCLFTPTEYISYLFRQPEFTEGAFWRSGINTLVLYAHDHPSPPLWRPE